MTLHLDSTFADCLELLREGVPARLRMRDSLHSQEVVEGLPPGWFRGFAAIQEAMSLPARRIALDRGGLFALITALGRSRLVRASRSIEIRWESGRPAEAVVRPGLRPVPLHDRSGVEGPGGRVRVAVGYHLRCLAGLLPWMDSADLFLVGPGLPSFWSVRLGGFRVLLGLPNWTTDGRFGSLRLDSASPPVEPGRFLTGQVVASFRDHPAQTRKQVVERTRGSEAAVLAVLNRLAGLGQILPEPDTGLFRWRSAWGDPASIPLDPKPAEVIAARGIVRTTSVQITRDEVRPDGKGRRVEGTILDRPVAIDLDRDGWLQRGQCTCTDHLARRLGPCRHLLALQAQAEAPAQPSTDRPDLAAWLAGFPASNPI